jgi:S-DNA-T family DNA segregation ATPase FtsK/SpoIIIE
MSPLGNPRPSGQGGSQGYEIERSYQAQPGCLSGCAVVILRVHRLAWRHRATLKPFGLALGVLMVTVAGRTASGYRLAWQPFVLLGGAALGAAAGLWWFGHRVRLDRTIERGYAAAVAVACGAWAEAAYYRGPLYPPVLWALLVGTLAGGVPWWWHRRIRRRTGSGIQRWKADLEQHESGSTVGRPRFDPDGGCAIPWELPAGRTIDDVRPAVGRLESLLDLRPGAIEIDQDQARKRLVWLRISPRDPHKQALAYPGPPRDATITQPVTIGRYLDGGPTSTPLLGLHALIAGTTGSGKSGVLNVVVAGLAACPDVVLWGCDLKHGLELGPWEPVFGRIATTPDQAADLLEAAVRVQAGRGQEMARRKVRTWPTSPTTPALVVLIDEHKPLGGNKRAIEAIETLTSQGRAMAVSLIDTTQYPTVPALGSSLIAPQCAVKVCLRVNTPGEANVILGPGSASAGWKAHEIPKGKPGTLYLDAPGADSPRLARAYHVTDAMVQRMARAYTGRRPTLDLVSERAVSPAGSPGHSPPDRPPGSPILRPTDGPPAAHWARPTPRPPGSPLGNPTGSPPAGPPASPPPGPEGNGHDGPVGAAGEGDPVAALLAALQAAGERGTTVAELAVVTGMRKTWVYDRLGELATAGRVVRGPHSRWYRHAPEEGGLQTR